jgi:hypothetical protein
MPNFETVAEWIEPYNHIPYGSYISSSQQAAGPMTSINI